MLMISYQIYILFHLYILKDNYPNITNKTNSQFFYGDNQETMVLITEFFVSTKGSWILK